MQVCEHRLQRHLMACIMRQEDESVASSRLRMRVGAILARHITRAFGEAIFASFRSVNLCFVLTIIISLASLLLLLWFLSFLFFFCCNLPHSLHSFVLLFPAAAHRSNTT